MPYRTKPRPRRLGGTRVPRLVGLLRDWVADSSSGVEVVRAQVQSRVQVQSPVQVKARAPAQVLVKPLVRRDRSRGLV